MQIKEYTVVVVVVVVSKFQQSN